MTRCPYLIRSLLLIAALSIAGALLAADFFTFCELGRLC